MKRYCPICKTIPILRREVRTCGTPSCLETWRSLTIDQKARALDHQPLEEQFGIIDLEDLKKQARGEMPFESSTDRLKRLIEEEKKQQEVNLNPKSFLDKVLGKEDKKE